MTVPALVLTIGPAPAAAGGRNGRGPFFGPVSTFSV
jgi:hypothetical protein